ncbi:hypothetical protein BaRGS_00006267 [Batillaria attramentaria]|uniref:Uncharacterized protein n=1 Tax=Batillaria attramentaria TaxID=370345 RepID=A0ABD0LTH3_9CAEN
MSWVVGTRIQTLTPVSVHLLAIPNVKSTRLIGRDQPTLWSTLWLGVCSSRSLSAFLEYQHSVFYGNTSLGASRSVQDCK